VVALLQRGQALWALAEVGAHLAASLLMTLAGMATVLWVRGLSL